MNQSHGQTPGNSDGPQRERLPSFLLSSAGGGSTGMPGGDTPPTYPFARNSVAEPVAFEEPSATTWPFQTRRPGGAPIAFNDRLRSDRASGVTGTPLNRRTEDASPISTPTTTTIAPYNGTGDSMRTPSRMPPNKSLLDAGPPSVLQVRPPSGAPSTPGSFARGTPHYPSPASTPGGLLSPGESGSVGGGGGRWVTIFGFSADMESQALREFRRHGDIVRTVPGKGNWVHILYRTSLQAQVALYRTWRILSGTDVMVGAVSCTEPDVARQEDDAVERGFLVASPSAASTPVPPSSSPETSAKLHHRSPASATLRSPSDVLRRGTARNTGATPSVVQTPQRQTGLFDYITGFYK